MATKINNARIKRRAGEAARFSSSFSSEISKNLNPLLKKILSNLKGELTPDKVKSVIGKYVTSKEADKVVSVLVEEQGRGLKLTAARVLRHLAAVKSGKKNVTIMQNLQAKPSHLVNYDPLEAKEALDKLIKEELAKLRGALSELKPNFQRDLEKRLKAGADKVTYENRPKKRILRELRAALTRQVKGFSKFAALNSAGQSLNQGEVLGFKAAKKVPAIKQWISKFDDKVRNWHDRVNFQARQS